MNVNTSGMNWEVSGKKLIAPLTTIKGLGEKAIEQILANRPFQKIEDFLFNENIVYSKLNKKALDVLIRAGAMADLIDDRFSGAKHFWSAVCVDRPRKLKNLNENIDLYRPEGSFSEEEIITFITNLTGMFPFSLVVTPDVEDRLADLCVPPISEYDPALMLCWVIPREILLKKTKRGKPYYQVEVIDTNSKMTRIRCWGIDPDRDILHLNRPYLMRPTYNEDWGFSTRGPVGRTWKLLG